MGSRWVPDAEWPLLPAAPPAPLMREPWEVVTLLALAPDAASGSLVGAVGLLFRIFCCIFRNMVCRCPLASPP